MKPVAVFRHSGTEGPGYFARYLDEHGVPWTLVRIDSGDPLPPSPAQYSGLVFMGGPMSVNDDLPWIPRVLALIARAVDEDVPVLGHCLGGQLMSKALGGTVAPNPVKEIGWGAVDVVASGTAHKWLGAIESFESFHWHGETFTIPPGAERIASSQHCANQMYALGPHLGMQCHVEMTPELIAAWCRDWAKEVTDLAQHSSSVQTPEKMLDRVEDKVRGLNATADRIYSEWIKGL